MYNRDTYEQVTVHIFGFDGNYLGREQIKRTEVEVRVGMLRNAKGKGKDRVNKEMVQGDGKMV